MTARIVLVLGVAVFVVLAGANPLFGSLGCIASFYFGRMYQVAAPSTSSAGKEKE